MTCIFRAALIAFGLMAVLALTATAGERDFRMSAPADLIESGFLKYLLPRFSLKTQTRIELVVPGAEAEAALGGDGIPVFEGLDRTWRFLALSDGHPGVSRFTDWITSDICQRTITAFEMDGTQAFTLPRAEVAETATLDFDGDAAAGRGIARTQCGRCHATSEQDRMNSIGSTPSFFVLRSLPDWEDRFAVFYVLNPHPSFTQVAEVTPPFPIDRPPPIVPLDMTLADLEAIIAYVAGLDPADLGAPLRHQ